MIVFLINFTFKIFSTAWVLLSLEPGLPPQVAQADLTQSCHPRAKSVGGPRESSEQGCLQPLPSQRRSSCPPQLPSCRLSQVGAFDTALANPGGSRGRAMCLSAQGRDAPLAQPCQKRQRGRGDWGGGAGLRLSLPLRSPSQCRPQPRQQSAGQMGAKPLLGGGEGP